MKTCLKHTWHLQADFFSGVNNSKVYEPGTYFPTVTKKTLLANVDASGAYGPIVFNNGSTTIYALISFTAYAAGDPSKSACTYNLTLLLHGWLDFEYLLKVSLF